MVEQTGVKGLESQRTTQSTRSLTFRGIGFCHEVERLTLTAASCNLHSGKHKFSTMHPVAGNLYITIIQNLTNLKVFYITFREPLLRAFLHVK